MHTDNGPSMFVEALAILFFLGVMAVLVGAGTGAI